MWPFSRGSSRTITDTEAADAQEIARSAESAVAVAVDASKDAYASMTMDGGLQNFAAGLNTDRDPRSHSQYMTPQELLNGGNANQPALDRMTRVSWLARRIVHTLADDMMRAGWQTSWDNRDKRADDSKAVTKLETDFNVGGMVGDGVAWGRQYGGAAILIGIKGQEDLSQPLVLDSIKKDSLQYLQTFDRFSVQPIGGDIITDLTDRRFWGFPRYYTITDAQTLVPSVHRSRLVIFDGTRLPRRSWRENSYWHDSVLISAMESVKNYDTATGGVASLIFSANVDIMKIPNLAEMLSTDKGRAKLIARFTTTAMMRSMNRMLLLDGGKEGFSDSKAEEFEQKQANFAGINETIRGFMTDVAGAADVPITRLFGQSPGGLNSTGDGDLRNYYDHVAARQKRDMLPQLSYLYEVIMRSALGTMPKNFEITFNPLWQASDVDRATIADTQADTDQKYITMGVATPMSIAKELKERGTYATFDDSDVKLAEEMHAQAQEQEQAAIENAAKAAAAASEAPTVAPPAA